MNIFNRINYNRDNYPIYNYIEFSKRQLKSLKKIENMGNNATFYHFPKDSDLIIKSPKFSIYHNEDYEKYLIDLINSSLEIEGVAIPGAGVICEGQLVGFILPNFGVTSTFKEIIGDNRYDLTKRIRAIEDTTTQLKEIHSHDLVLYDVHSQNFLVDSRGRGYTVDIDGGMPATQKVHDMTKYSFEDNLDLVANDLIKYFMCACSVLIDVPFEDIIESKIGFIWNLKNFKKVFPSHRLKSLFNDVDKELIWYLDELVTTDHPNLYFDTILDQFKDPEKLSYHKKKILKRYNRILKVPSDHQ